MPLSFVWQSHKVLFFPFESFMTHSYSLCFADSNTYFSSLCKWTLHLIVFRSFSDPIFAHTLFKLVFKGKTCLFPLGSCHTTFQLTTRTGAWAISKVLLKYWTTCNHKVNKNLKYCRSRDEIRNRTCFEICKNIDISINALLLNAFSC